VQGSEGEALARNLYDSGINFIDFQGVSGNNASTTLPALEMEVELRAGMKVELRAGSALPQTLKHPAAATL